MTHYSGTIRIKSLKTLQRWIDKGWYQNMINEGYVFSVGCGRFTKHVCTCTLCRNRSRHKLTKILNSKHMYATEKGLPEPKNIQFNATITNLDDTVRNT